MARRSVSLVVFVVACLAPALVGADLISVRCEVVGGPQTGPTGPSGEGFEKGKTVICLAKGQWLDLTDQVQAPGGLAASKSGTGNHGRTDAYVQVRIQISSSCSSGDKRITLSRPALGGRDKDEFFFKVK